MEFGRSVRCTVVLLLVHPLADPKYTRHDQCWRRIVYLHTHARPPKTAPT